MRQKIALFDLRVKKKLLHFTKGTRKKIIKYELKK